MRELPPGSAPTVAVVGPVGAGKSALRGLFREFGAATLDFDGYSRDLLAAGTPETAAVRAAWGEPYVRPDGTVDRAALGALVFADDAARTRLEAIVHPPMLALLRRRLEDFRRAPEAPLLAVEGAILGRLAAGTFDALIVVDAPPAVRRQRLEQGKGLTPEAALRLVALHERLGIGRDPADFVVDNGGSPAELRAQAEELWRRLTGRDPGTLAPGNAL